MPKHISRIVQERRDEARRNASSRRLKIGAFALVALAVLGASVFLVVSPLRALRAPGQGTAGPAGETHQVIVSMAGFDPPSVRVPAGRPFTIQIVNPDSQFHTDGGGWHQFHVDALNLDVRIPPRSEQSQTFPGLAPGKYEFYCDVCCGGKENPSMRGVIEVTG